MTYLDFVRETICDLDQTGLLISQTFQMRN